MLGDGVMMVVAVGMNTLEEKGEKYLGTEGGEAVLIIRL